MQENTCQLIRLQLEVQGDMLMLSSTKPAALPPPPGVKRRVEMIALYHESVAMSRSPLWNQPSKSLQLFSLENLNG